MTREQFNEVVERRLQECKEILGTKGTDYSDRGDRLSNFKIIARLAGVSVETVWLIFFLKHVMSVCTFCQRGKLESEPLGGRISDIINYALLLEGIEEERAAERQMEAAEKLFQQKQAVLEREAKKVYPYFDPTALKMIYGPEEEKEAA